MTREERLAILGPVTVAAIRARVALAPEPTEELVEKLRRIMTNPAGEIPAPRPAAPAGHDEPPASSYRAARAPADWRAHNAWRRTYDDGTR